jgi:hypothetical protein
MTSSNFVKIVFRNFVLLDAPVVRVLSKTLCGLLITQNIYQSTVQCTLYSISDPCEHIPRL